MTLNARRLTGRNTVMIVKLGVSERPRDFTYKMKKPGDKQVEEEKVDCYSIVAIQHTFTSFIVCRRDRIHRSIDTRQE